MCGLGQINFQLLEGVSKVHVQVQEPVDSSYLPLGGGS